MAERSLRGMSIGAKSLESDDNVDFETTSHMCARKGTVRFCRSLRARRFRRNGNAVAA